VIKCWPPDRQPHATGATGATVAGLGALGCATRRDLSSWARLLFWALLALIVFGVVLIFINIPHANIIYGVLGIVIFGGYTIVDFNRPAARKHVELGPYCREHLPRHLQHLPILPAAVRGRARLGTSRTLWNPGTRRVRVNSAAERAQP
jgi:Inhibitor of apoptosis-promoting Bax1